MKKIAILFLVFVCANLLAQEVTTLAGSGSLGSTNGTGTAASFYYPCGVAVDGSGNVYVADRNNHLIRKITSAGVVTTLAGSGSEGSADGTGTAASFYYPYGVAVDGSGNVYVADFYTHLIRKITSAGVVTTLAGSGSYGYADGTGTAASFNTPGDVAVDGSGNVYVADSNNHLIRKITSAGVVTTLAGSGSPGSTNGTGTAASFNLPYGVAVDGSGNVYVGDQSNHLIRKITSAGVVTTLAGSGSEGSADGTGTAASFYYPAGIIVDGSGNVYVGDTGNHLIRKITSAGVVTTLAGSGSEGSEDGTSTAASFISPNGVAVDGSGNVYVADTGNHLIRKITILTTFKVPSQYSTIQEAIDATSNGDTVLVSAGTYKENIDFKEKNIIVLGENKETTIIDGNATFTVVTMESLNSSAKLSNFTLKNGVGVGAWTGSALHISNCNQTSIQDIIIIDNNSNGATVSMNSSDGVILSNSKISGNSADNNHFWIEGGNVILKNLLIINNSGSGAIIKVHGNDTQLELWNSTITNNNLPPIKSSWAPITVKVKNTIFWGNSSDSLEFGAKLGNSIDISYSLHPGGHSGSDNIYKNPQFVKVITTGDEESDYHLSDWSPAIGAGTTTGAPTTDIEGNPRPNPAGSNPDMGAFENTNSTQQNRKIYISVNGDSTANGTSAYPLESIQRGIDMSINGDTVLVAVGTYTENINFNGKKIVVGSLYLTTSDSSYISSTIIDGNKSGSVVTLDSGVDATTVLSGFTIQNGLGDFGGGIDCSSNPNINNIRLINNIASYGAGICVRSNCRLSNVRIENNIGGHGGGIFIFSGANPIIENITIIKNEGSPGAGIYIQGSDDLFIFNATIVNNQSDSGNDNGFVIAGDSKVSLVNSIVWDNNIIFNTWVGTRSISINNCVIQGGESSIVKNQFSTVNWGNGNIDSDPLFADSTNNNYRLSNASPAIGAGTTTGAPTTDIEGNPRPNPAGSNPDMGAYENKWGTPQNATPVITAMSDVTVNEDEFYSDTLRATDEEGDAITYSASSDTSAVTASITDSILTLTPNANWHGVANIKAYASDGISKDSTSFKLTVNPVSDIAAVQDVTIDEDKSAEVTLTSSFSGTTTFSAVSDTNAVTTSIGSSTLTLTPTANWHGVATIKAYASDGSYKDSTSFKLTVTPVQDAPTAFEWVSSALDTVNITQSNLDDTYNLQWGTSTDAADGDSITYLVYAKIGVYPAEEAFDTTSTSVSITYQELLENVFEPFPMLPRVTVQFFVEATDGTDTVKVTGDDRVVFVNRYEYLSTVSEGIPTEFALHENYPNPFNPTTTLRFDLPQVSSISLTIYNMLGQKVKTFNMQSTPAGYHSVKWNATNDYGDPVGAGVYLYQLQTKDFVKTRKMVLLK